MNFQKSEGDIAIRFRMPRLRIIVSSPILPILTLKLVTMATSLEPSEKGGHIGNIRSNNYYMVKIWWKIGPVDPELSLLISLFLKKEKEEINANRSYSLQSIHATLAKLS